MGSHSCDSPHSNLTYDMKDILKDIISNIECETQCILIR